MNIKKIILSFLLIIFAFSALHSQTISCTTELGSLAPADLNNSNYVVPATGKTCVSSNLTIAYLEIADGGTLVIKKGVTLTITNGVRPDNVVSRLSTIQVYGNLKFSQSTTIPMSTNLTIYNGGVITVGSNGKDNLAFKGNATKIINEGIFNAGTIDFTNASSINTIDNQGTMFVSGNINFQGTNYFRNAKDLIISSSFNSNANSVYVNCGTFTTQGFNLQGGKIYNSGTFKATGAINFGNYTAFFENYGTFNGTSIQLGNGSSYVFNSGNFLLTENFQNDGILKGPTSGQNYGKFTLKGKAIMNNGSVTGKLNFLNSNGTSDAATMFNNGISIASSVKFGNCATCTINTASFVCLNPDGTTPITVTGVADNFSTSTSGGTTISVLANDTYNGGTADSSNINLAIVGTWPVGFTLNSNGTITVASGTAAGSYPLQYRICAIANAASCSTTTATLLVATAIEAVADVFSVNASQAIAGTTTVGNVLTNDKVNGIAATNETVTISLDTAAIPAYSGSPVPTLSTVTGIISIPAGTPAGVYTIKYKICGSGATTACDSDTVTITVDEPAITAVADNFTVVADGSNTTSVLANDTYNNGSAGSGNNTIINTTIINTTVVNLSKVGMWPAGFILNTNGTITVALDTPAGNYVLEYRICDKINPANCKNALATINITACFKEAILDLKAGTTLDTSVGITSLERAGVASAWPQIRKSGWIVLEAKTKGFVINRMPFNAVNKPVNKVGDPVITNPIEGMMVYDTTNNCLRVYTSVDKGANFGWFCMSTQACPE